TIRAATRSVSRATAANPCPASRANRSLRSQATAGSEWVGSPRASTVQEGLRKSLMSRVMCLDRISERTVETSERIRPCDHATTLKQVKTLRPADLAREHGLSAQAVRNYERHGFLPAAERTPTGYRIYTEHHAAALRAYLASVAAFGHARAGAVMRALHSGDLDAALAAVDDGHVQLVRDRETLGQVRTAIGHLADQPPEDRKSTRLNSSHVKISYAVFCLKKKNDTLLRAQDRSNERNDGVDPSLG